MRTRHFAFLAAASIALAANVAHAQPRSEGEAARREFELGVQLLDDARFAEAAAAFEHSLSVRESGAALYNLGLAYRGMGAYRRAIGALERFVARGRADNPALLAEARNTAQELRRALVHVTVRLRGGGDALVDGVRVGSGEGAYAVDLDPGRHVFETRRRGYRAQHVEASYEPAASASVDLTADASPLPATLFVESDQAGAVIQIDGRFAGRGHFAGSVPAGTHGIDVMVEGRSVAHRAVDLAPGGRERVVLSLRTTSPLSTWWFWTGTAAVAGALVVGAVLLVPNYAPYEEGTLGFVVQGARAR